jgi:transcriptional regulator with XRE-family HTH domain
MDIDAIVGTSADAVIRGIAERVKSRRLEKDLTQKAFAARAGVGYDAYRKFETTGDITLRNLVQCALVLDDLEGFNELFVTKQYTSLDALIESKQGKTKKRGTRNE